MFIAVDLEGTLTQLAHKHEKDMLEPDPEANKLIEKLKKLGTKKRSPIATER